MLPSYRYMDSYHQSPHRRNHMPHSHHYYPSWELIPPQSKVDPPISPVACEPWPYGGSYGYPNPLECHGCCPSGHYNFRPPHHHLPSPPYPYYLNACPPYSGAYPAYYVPTPHYSMGQPRYEYDKSVPRSHCCGCPNHMCNQQEDKCMKIEEQEPDFEKRELNSSGPLKVQNHQYPIVWIPPEYMKSSEGSKDLESEPKISNGWLPLNMNSLGSLKQGEDEKRNQNQQSEEKKAEFPLPVIWMPAYDKPGEIDKKDLEGVDDGPKSAEELPPKFKIIAVKPPENDGHRNKAGAVDDPSGGEFHSKMIEKESQPKKISVKQMDDCGEKQPLRDAEKKSKGNSAEHTSVSEEKNSSDSDARRKTSPPKASKLPPVCLRVDPLPRRKNGNGTSRSPSPPGLKEKVQPESNGTPKSPSRQGTKSEELYKAEEVQPNKKDIRVVEVKERTKDDQSKKEDFRNKSQAQIPVNMPVVSDKEVSGKPVKEKSEVSESKNSTEGDKGETEPEQENLEGARRETKDLSTTEAAVHIQSAYRGFEVRKWQPMKKLRQLTRVRAQMDEVRGRISCLESSSDLLKDEKQKLIIGETIMSLLLHLDTIQGLHPSLRDIRKSVARELVCLQEKLDSLATQKPCVPTSTRTEEEPAVEPATEDICKTVHDNRYMPPEENEEQRESGPTKDLCETACHSSSGPTELSHESEESVATDSKVEEVAEPLLVDKEIQADSGRELTEQPTVRAEEPLVELKDDVTDEVPDANPKEMVEVQKVSDTPKSMPEKCPEQLVEPSVDNNACDLEVEVKSTTSAKVVESSPVNEYPKVNQLTKPIGLFDEEPPVSNMEYVEIVSGKDEELLLKGDYSDDSKLAELIVLPAKKEKCGEEELIEVFKPEEPVNIQLSEEGSPAEKPKEVFENSDFADVCSPLDSLPTTESTSSEDMVVSIKESKVYNSNKRETGTHAETEVPKVEERALEEIGDHHSQSPSSEESEDISIELAKNETEEPQESEALTCKDRMVEQTCESEIAQEAVIIGIGSDSASAELEEEEGDRIFKASNSRASLIETEVERVNDKKLVEENEKLREMVEQLIQAGKEQLTVISALNGRVRDLEKMRKKKKLRVRPRRATVVKPSNNLSTAVV